MLLLFIALGLDGVVDRCQETVGSPAHRLGRFRLSLRLGQWHCGRRENADAGDEDCALEPPHGSIVAQTVSSWSTYARLIFRSDRRSSKRWTTGRDGEEGVESMDPTTGCIAILPPAGGVSSSYPPPLPLLSRAPATEMRDFDKATQNARVLHYVN